MNLVGILPALLTLKIIYGYLCTASTSHFLMFAMPPPSSLSQQHTEVSVK